MRRGPPRWTSVAACTPSPRSGTPRVAARASSGVEAAADRSRRHCVRSVETAWSVVNGPPLRHRRDACDVAPRLRGCQAAMGVHALRAARSWSEGWSVTLAGLDATSFPHRFGFVAIDAARLTRLLSLQRMGAVLFQSARCSATFSFLSIQAKSRPTHAAWAASMRAESKTRRRRMALSCAHHSWLALLQP